MTSYGNLEVRQTGHADLHQALSGRSELEEQDESQSFIPTRDIDQNYLQQCKSSDGYDEADGTPRTPDIEEPEEQSSVHLDALESRNDIPVVSFEACSISDGPQTFPKSDNQTDSHEVRTCWQNFQMSRVIVANYVESEGKS